MSQAKISREMLCTVIFPHSNHNADKAFRDSGRNPAGVTIFRTFKNARFYSMPGAPYARIQPCNVILVFTYQLHGQETTGTSQLFLATTQGFRLHHKRERELYALI